MRVAAILALCVTLLASLAGAQNERDVTPDTLWADASVATAAERWNDAIPMWTALLNAKGWPFGDADHAREIAQLAHLRCVRGTGDSARAEAMAADLVAQHPSDDWTPAIQAAQVLIALDRKPALNMDAAVGPWLERPGVTAAAVTRFCLTVADWTADDPAISRSVAQWLARNPKASSVASGWSSALYARQRYGLLVAHADVVLAATAGSNQEWATWLDVADACTEVGQPERAEGILGRLQDPAVDPLEVQASWLCAEYAMGLDSVAVMRDMARGLDDPLASAKDDEALLAGLAMQRPGAVRLVDDALGAYLTSRPRHARRGGLLLQRIRLLLQMGDDAQALLRARSAWETLAGTSNERDARALVLEALIAGGRREAAGDLAMELATPVNPEAKRDTAMLRRAMAMYRSAGAVEKASKTAESCLTEKGVTMDALRVLLWAGMRSQGSGAFAAARRCYDMVAATMPEHEVGRTARSMRALLAASIASPQAGGGR